MGLLPILYGVGMAIKDAFSLSMLKAIHLKWVSPYFFVLTVLLYSFQPYIFLQSLNFEGVIIMNLLWDLLSSVFVTFIGLYLFNEEINMTKWAGIVLSFVSIYLMAF